MAIPETSDVGQPVVLIPESDSAADVSGPTYGGASIPSVTIEQRLALTPSLSDQVYDTDMNALMFWDGIAWRVGPGQSMIYGGGSVAPEIDDVTVTGIETSELFFGYKAVVTGDYAGLWIVGDSDGIIDLTTSPGSGGGGVNIANKSSKIYLKDLIIDWLTLTGSEIDSVWVNNCTANYIEIDREAVSITEEVANATIAAFSDSLLGIQLQSDTITTIDMSSCTEIFDVYALSTPVSTYIPPITGFSTAAGAVTISMYQCALSQESVDAILNACPDTVSGYLGLSGGTSAHPSVAVSAKLDALIAAGWTIALN